VRADPSAERLTTSFLERLVADPRLVVGGTCLSSHHPLIARKRFDVCIVDEAGQLTQPVCLGPLANAKVFVLVGDHNQLPPLVRSDKARELGMDVSLFARLSEAFPNVVAKLALQFRMNAEVSRATSAVYISF
jgi:DNA replication ATP-dependent helicase Dna2